MTDDLLISGEMDINLCLSVAVLQQINMDHLQWSVAQYQNLSFHGFLIIGLWIKKEQGFVR